MTSLPDNDLPPVISPIKKALRSFLKKKEDELKQLNERLDVYIKKVKTLEDSNSQLTAEKEKLIVEVTEWKTSKETEIKQFELKLEDANRLCDKILRERDRVHNENRKNAALADEYKKKLDKEIEAHKVTEDALKGAQWKLSEKEGQLVARNQEIKNLEAKILQRKKECQELKGALESAKYDLEQETLLKMDLESKLLAARAELASKEKTHEKVIVEIRRQLREAEEKRFEVESEMKTRYEEMLAQQLQELRNELETHHNSEYYELQQTYLTAVAELTTVREEKRTWSINVENLRLDLSQWQSKCDELQQMYTKYWEELSSVREENRNLTIDIENLKLQIGQWESENASLVLKIEDLKKLRAADNRRSAEIIAQKDVLIKELKQWIVTNHKYDEELMEVNQMLDSDIKDYRRMIEDEEGRWNINRRKRRRIEFEGMSCIQIEEASNDGKFVRLSNSGTEDFSLGGWSVERSVDGEPPVIYKFTSRFVLKTGSYVTIWAARSGGQHNPPTDLVFKRAASWGVGKETKTVLWDSNGQMQQSRVCVTSEAHEDVDGETNDQRSPGLKRMRRRVGENEHCNEGLIRIEEANINGKFVKLFNGGSKDFPLGGWTVERSVDGQPPVIYKFTSRYVLKTGSYVTIWAARSGGQHNPPTDLVFKQKASWGVGKETKTLLKDSAGQEEATLISDEASVTRTDEAGSHGIKETRGGRHPPPCTIQ